MKATLGEEVEVGKERYGMNWPGKAILQKVIQEPCIGTLKPVKEASVDFDTTENLFIEGDSLEVLKLLQKSYYGKIKMIYIDPPYNTGKDFIYPDNYTESLETYLRYTGQKGESGLKLTTNTDTEGRYHSKWMNMMYPRLFLARNLLKEDGMIFISIDDHEVDNLKKICNEIFGEENFIGNFIWKKKGTSTNVSGTHLSSQTEYILCIGKSEFSKLKKRLTLAESREYPYSDKEGRYRTTIIEKKAVGNYDRVSMKYPILGITPRKDKRWQIGEARARELEQKGRFIDDNGIIKLKIYDFEERDTESAQQNLLLDHGSTQEGQNEVDKLLFPGAFDNPKPKKLIKHLVNISCDDNDKVLDFFAGSATTAQAVLDLNKEDQGNRKFIMVQLQEPTAEDSEAHKAGYKNIAEIGEERIRRVIKKIKDGNEGKIDSDEKKLDLGFKVFRLDESNFKIWNKKSEVPLQEQLQLSVDNINPKSNELDILYEIILKSGFSLSVPVEKTDIEGKTVFSVDNKSLVICLENDLTQELMKKISDMEAVRVVFLDKGFNGNDELKTNTVELMKAKGIEFKTV